MTENEAIEKLKTDNCVECGYSDNATTCDYGACGVAIATRMAIKALQEIQQYRAIGTPEKIAEELNRLRNDNECQGLYFTLEERQDLARQHRELEEYQSIGTPEECREAVEKLKAKKPTYKHYEEKGEPPYIKITCPNECGIRLYPVTDKHFAHEHVFCPKCGQKLDWSEEE